MLRAADVLLTDPPYGINYRVNERKAGTRGAGLIATKAIQTAAKGPIAGDDAPFDYAPWHGFTTQAIFGADHFAVSLPVGGKWIIWDKRRGSARDSHSDCEMVWTNRPGASRVHGQKWRGVVREGEENCSRSKKLHPNQKPVALLQYVLEELKVGPRQLIADPFMGSGSSGVAALRMGCSFIGCEVDPNYFAIARERLLAEGGIEL